MVIVIYLLKGLKMQDRMLKWFACDHLPDHLKEVSSKFKDVANYIALMIPEGPERTVALRKLLESKDAAVRSVVHPGG